jgi:hypothetical protein
MSLVCSFGPIGTRMLWKYPVSTFCDGLAVSGEGLKATQTGRSHPWMIDDCGGPCPIAVIKGATRREGAAVAIKRSVSRLR